MDNEERNRLIEKYRTTVENKYFDRKSAQKKPSEVANLVTAFANTEGGTIVVGISNSGHLEGFKVPKAHLINDFIAMPKNECQPMPKYSYQEIKITNENGDEDVILVINVEAEIDRIIRTKNGSVYVRIGDETRKLEADDLRQFEYSKNVRRYEDEIMPDATIDDLDDTLINEYKTRIDAVGMSNRNLLVARGLMRVVGNKDCVTNAAVLLFAKNILKFYQNCRIRFIRYNGTYMGVGQAYNVIKDVSIDKPLLLIIESAKEIVRQQLRDFTNLNSVTGKFETVPEYPEFAWVEGIVNAVVHREYALTGSHILVSMYDDRLEIKSPGKLPGFVTVKNICENRFSRNQRISRVFYDMGWVRELNEGVKRIYKDMRNVFLDDPEYLEDDSSVTLRLKNNFVARYARRNDQLISRVGIEDWDFFDDSYKKMLHYIVSHLTVTKKELARFLNLSDVATNKRLNHLIDVGLIRANGHKNAPNRTYEFIWKDRE